MKEKINQTAGRLKQTVRAVGVGIATLTASFFMSAPAYAAGVQDSQIVKGTEKLVGDVTTWLMVLAPEFLGVQFERMTLPAAGTYGSMTGMGGRSMFAPDFSENARILRQFLYGVS